MHITIIRIAARDKQFEDVAQEYLKRLGSACTVKTIKPLKNLPQDETIKRETELCIDALGTVSGDARVFVLQLGAKEYSSEMFSTQFCGHLPVVFLIGGPYGFDYDRLTQAGVKPIGFGKHTMPHGLAFVTLLEQLYRGWTLQVGKTYHY